MPLHFNSRWSNNEVGFQLAESPNTGREMGNGGYANAIVECWPRSSDPPPGGGVDRSVFLAVNEGIQLWNRSLMGINSEKKNHAQSQTLKIRKLCACLGVLGYRSYGSSNSRFNGDAFTSEFTYWS